jgi:ABC-type multidrug transport system fused ATPase/permease subunit
MKTAQWSARPAPLPAREDPPRDEAGQPAMLDRTDAFWSRRAWASHIPDIPPSDMPQRLSGFVKRVSFWHQGALSVLSVLVFMLSTAPLEVQRRIVNDAFKGGDFHVILLLALAYGGLAVAEGLIKLGMNIYRGYVSEIAVRSLRRTIHGLVAEVGSAASPEATGIESSMMLAEAEPVGAFVGVYLSEPLLTGGMLVSVFGYMIYLQPLMALVAFVIFSPQLVFVPLMQRAINRKVSRRITTLRDVGSSLVATSMQGASGADQDARIDSVFGLNMGIFTVKFTMNFLMNLLHHVGTASVLAAGGWFVIHGQTEVGTVVAFISGLSKINDPWGDLVNWFRDLWVTTTKYEMIATAVTTLEETRPAVP